MGKENDPTEHSKIYIKKNVARSGVSSAFENPPGLRGSGFQALPEGSAAPAHYAAAGLGVESIVRLRSCCMGPSDV